MTPHSNQDDHTAALTAGEAMTLLQAITITVGVWGEPTGEIRTMLLAGIRKLAKITGVAVGQRPIKELQETFRQEIGEVYLCRRETRE